MLDIFHKLPAPAKKFLETQGGCQARVWFGFGCSVPCQMGHCINGYLVRCPFLRTGERPGIVVLTIGLEESLPKLPSAVVPSKLWSPYRLPLIRFLNQYPTER